MAQMIPFPTNTNDIKAGKKAKKKDPKGQPVQPHQLLGQRLVAAGIVTEEQVTAALLHQSSSGERLGRILYQQGIVSASDLAQHLTVAAARSAAVTDLETAFQNTLADLVSRHSRYFLVFLVVCIASLIAVCVAGSMIPLSVYICAAAAFAGIYNQLQRRHYDLHAFATRARISLLNSLKHCNSVAEIDMVMAQSAKFFVVKAKCPATPLSNVLPATYTTDRTSALEEDAE